jgi:hypothetical protein
MKKILLTLDPLLCQGLGELCGRLNKARTEVIRDAIYTAVWNELRGQGAALQQSPRCSEVYENSTENYRVQGKRLVRVNRFGLVIEAVAT